MRQRPASFGQAEQNRFPASPISPGGIVLNDGRIRPPPLQPVRRFDVFAETKRLEALAHGEPEDVAKGYGIRIAKIVASRRRRRLQERKRQEEIAFRSRHFAR